MPPSVKGEFLELLLGEERVRRTVPRRGVLEGFLDGLPKFLWRCFLGGKERI